MLPRKLLGRFFLLVLSSIQWNGSWGFRLLPASPTARRRPQLIINEAAQREQSCLPLSSQPKPRTCTPLFSTPTTTSPSSALEWVVSAAATNTANANSKWSNVVIGEADRAFMLGMRLEKNGQARAASASFHEAATLYQCVLDSPSEFGHVTALTVDECRHLLGYACVRLAHLNHDALGDAKAAVRLFKEAIAIDEPRPSALSFDGLGTSLEAAFPDQLSKALEAYQQATQRQQDPRVLFHLAVALERSGQTEISNELLERLRRLEAEYACWVDSWGYVRWHSRKVPNEHLNLYMGTRDMLQVALDAAMPLIEESNGWVCEFGVASGRSLRMTQEILPLHVPIHGFDTFTGLPQAWGKEPKGSYSTGGILPNMEGKVYFYKGLFRDTIPIFIEQQQKQAADHIGDDGNMVLAYANIDCDLYSSTLEVLEAMHGRIVPGTILVFDEYIGHPSWRQDEFRAWRECCKRFGWQYEYLAFSLFTKQAVVRITDA